MKLRTALLIFLTLLMVSSALPSFAAGTVGVIDVQRIFKDYAKTSSAQSQIKKEEESFKKEIEKGQEKISKARQANKGQAEIDKISKELESQLTPQREKLMTLTGKLTSEIQADIVAAVNAVAKKVGIDTVLDKQAVITGGVDITDLVISQLNSKGK